MKSGKKLFKWIPRNSIQESTHKQESLETKQKEQNKRHLDSFLEMDKVDILTTDTKILDTSPIEVIQIIISQVIQECDFPISLKVLLSDPLLSGAMASFFPNVYYSQEFQEEPLAVIRCFLSDTFSPSSPSSPSSVSPSSSPSSPSPSSPLPSSSPSQPPPSNLNSCALVMAGKMRAEVLWAASKVEKWKNHDPFGSGKFQMDQEIKNLVQFSSKYWESCWIQEFGEFGEFGEKEINHDSFIRMFLTAFTTTFWMSFHKWLRIILSWIWDGSVPSSKSKLEENRDQYHLNEELTSPSHLDCLCIFLIIRGFFASSTLLQKEKEKENGKEKEKEKEKENYPRIKKSTISN